jgi:uncharacterized zinc-type alcohol dehydrogenase-like protein
VLSRSPGKQDDVLRFGAADFADTTDRAAFGALANRFDIIINTASENLDIDAYLSLLRLDGVLDNVGASSHPVDSYNVFSLFNAQRTIASSTIGSVGETQEMLEFCAERQVVPEIETIGVGEVEAAWEKLGRCRYVIDISTFNG